MKLKDLSDLIVFDEFPKKYNPHHKIVLTHLLHLENQNLPERLSTIITTKHLGTQFEAYYKQKFAKCLNSAKFVYVEPYNYIDIVLGDRRTVQMLVCESTEATRNLMVFIREDGKLKCIYTGNFLDIRPALLNDTAASWIERDTVPSLYLNLKRWHENPEKQDVDLIYKVFDVVEQILKFQTNPIIHMYLPPFGYNNFISKLVCTFCKRVTISTEFKRYSNPIIDNDILELLCDSIEKTKIVIFPGTPTTEPVSDDSLNTQCQQVTVYIQEEYKNIEDLNISASDLFYKIYYSPEPSPFQLQFLCLLLKPKRLYGIIDNFNSNFKVPTYLTELCGITSPTGRKKKLGGFGGLLRSVAEVEKTDKRLLTFGPQTTNPTQGKELYLDDSESDS